MNPGPNDFTILTTRGVSIVNFVPNLGTNKGKTIRFLQHGRIAASFGFSSKNRRQEIERITKKSRTPGKSACLADEARGYEEALGAPERVVDVGAERLQLRGEAAVDHRAPARSRHELLHRAHLRPPVHAHLRMARRQPMERDLAST